MDARSARIVEPDDRSPGLYRQVHDLADLLAEGSGQRSAEHGEILAKNEHRATVDPAVAGDHAVAGNFGFVHAEVGAAMHHESVELFKGVGI